MCDPIREPRNLVENEIFLRFFNDPATTEIYTLSLHDALPISEYRHLPDPVTAGIAAYRHHVRLRLHLVFRPETLSSGFHGPSQLSQTGRVLLRVPGDRLPGIGLGVRPRTPPPR